MVTELVMRVEGPGKSFWLWRGGVPCREDGEEKELNWKETPSTAPCCSRYLVII